MAGSIRFNPEPCRTGYGGRPLDAMCEDPRCGHPLTVHDRPGVDFTVPCFLCEVFATVSEAIGLLPPTLDPDPDPDPIAPFGDKPVVLPPRWDAAGDN